MPYEPPRLIAANCTSADRDAAALHRSNLARFLVKPEVRRPCRRRVLPYWSCVPSTICSTCLSKIAYRNLTGPFGSAVFTMKASTSGRRSVCPVLGRRANVIPVRSSTVPAHPLPG